MNTTYYIGLDVHKDSIAIAYTRAGQRKDPTFHGTCGGSNLSAERALRKLAKQLEVEFKDLKVPELHGASRGEHLPQREAWLHQVVAHGIRNQ